MIVSQLRTPQDSLRKCRQKFASRKLQHKHSSNMDLCDDRMSRHVGHKQLRRKQIKPTFKTRIGMLELLPLFS
jgi:hypothetical protein